jgi:hypothetical protein
MGQEGTNRGLNFFKEKGKKNHQLREKSVSNRMPYSSEKLLV